MRSRWIEVALAAVLLLLVLAGVGLGPGEIGPVEAWRLIWERLVHPDQLPSTHQVLVFDPRTDGAETFAAEMSERLQIPVEPARSPRTAVRDADIICTATTSNTPVFADRDLTAGVHINAVGAFEPHAREIPGETVARARVVVDHRPSALSETGDLIQPIRQGLFGEDHIHAELGEVAGGQREGRATPEQVTLFKSVGVAIQDLAASLYCKQRRSGFDANSRPRNRATQDELVRILSVSSGHPLPPMGRAGTVPRIDTGLQ